MGCRVFVKYVDKDVRVVVGWKRGVMVVGVVEKTYTTHCAVMCG